MTSEPVLDVPRAWATLSDAHEQTGLVPVLVVSGDQFDDPVPIAAVLRSWEDRFGARLLEVGFAEIRLLVQRPPRTIEATRAVAAEHFAFADECGAVPPGSGALELAAVTNTPSARPV